LKRRDFLRTAALAAAANAALPAWAAPDAASLGDAGSAQPAVKRVLVVFMCHLDIGFTDTQANVMRQYFDVFYPQAIATAEAMQAAGGDRFVWTTFPWLLYEYLEQAGAADRKRMERAIRTGYITYHAMPFNWQTEMLDRSMIAGCLGFAATLDRRFGHKTIGGKMTDVPGHSRGLIAPLAAAGVTLLDIGVNPASTPPDVPEVFRWQNPDGASIAMLYHRSDYGGVIRVPNSNLAVAVEMRSDNSGPQSAQEIAAIYKKLRAQFPDAAVRASDFNEIATALAPLHAGLPVVTAEIGDTWIYGVASDPPKIARYREMARLRQEWLGEKLFASGGDTDIQLLRRLPLAVEHTWGTDTKRYIDHDHYPPTRLAKYLDTPGYRTMERSWQEKRDDIDQGMANLPVPFRNAAQKRLQALQPKVPEHAGMQPLAPNQIVHTPHFEIALDAKTGAVQHLLKRGTGKVWATAEQPLALFSYQTLTQADYTAFLAAYVRVKTWWAPQDFGKPNIDRFPAESRIWNASIKNQWIERGGAQDRIVAELAIEDEAAQKGGLVAWPQSIWMEMILPYDRPVIEITLSTFGKVANRMPEAMWFSFTPKITEQAKWTLIKVDQPVSPLDVVRGGGRRMHAVTGRFTCRDGVEQLAFETLDAPTIAFAPQSPLNFSEELPDVSKGVHVGLYNNAWGTNYPQWASGDWMYRLRLDFA
jgi:hypothetical protein